MGTTATLRAVGGSVVMTIHRHFLDVMSLKAGSQVDVTLKDGHLIVTPSILRKKYKLADLLAQCDASKPMSAEDPAWLDSPPVGLESI